MTETYDIEEVVGWTGLRAMLAAVKNAPQVPTTEQLFVSVEIRLHSETFPGKAESGRSKSRLVGSASCIWRGKEQDGAQ